MSNIVNQHTPRKSYRLKPDRLSLAYAKEQGYNILTFGDGYGEVIGKDGQHYTLSDFSCNCADATKNDGGSYYGYCKHSWWLSQLHICESCGGTSELVESENIRINHHSFQYVCSSCGNSVNVKEVHEIRQRHKQEIQRQATIARATHASHLIFGH